MSAAVARLDKKGREKCGHYVGGGCYCEHVASHHEDGEPRCGTHSKQAIAARTVRFRERSAAEAAARERSYALLRARGEVIQQAKAWYAELRDGVAPGERTLGLAAAVNALLALEGAKDGE